MLIIKSILEDIDDDVHEIEKKFDSRDLEKFEPIKHSNIFYDVDDFNTLEKKLSNLINIDEKKIRKK